MKTTLTLEDVERLEKWETFHDENWAPIDRGTLRGLLSLAKERLQGNPEGLLLPQGASPPVHSDVQPAGRFTHETVKSPGWYWFKSDFPGKWFSDRFVHLEEDSLEDGNKWLMGRNCQGLYFGPIDLDNLMGSIPSPSDVSLPSPLSGGVEEVKASQDGSVCEVEPLGEVQDENPKMVRFLDHFNQGCLLVQNLVRNEEPWVNICVNGRDPVSLSKQHAIRLIAHLQAWVETGSFRLVPRGGAAEPLTNH